MSKCVLILGGYGVFGGKLAKALSSDARFEVIVAGRSFSKASAFCTGTPCRPAQLDTHTNDFADRLAAEAPFIVVDASGPFQRRCDDRYPIARAALAAGAHYLDLSDDGNFTANISILDDQAREKSLTVLSGVSSVPALSSAAVTRLNSGMEQIDHIESVILPGNRAPRGLSVVRAIAGQAGRPMRIWQAGQWKEVAGWGDITTLTLSLPGAPTLRRRWASLIGAPDLQLFPAHFNARSVSFRAGLDLKLMHGGLSLLSQSVRWKWLPSLAPLARPLKWVADRLEPFGSSTGGMRVSVTGLNARREPIARDWTLIVEGGDGPAIPAIPAEILCRKIASGEIAPGARPCLNEFTLDEAEHALGRLRVTTGQTERPAPFLFTTILGDQFKRLPPPIQQLHAVSHARRWTGRASIVRGTSLLSRLAGAIAGFPPAGNDVPVTVSMTRDGEAETWQRTFGTHTFRSQLSAASPPGSGRMRERFGLLSFTIALGARDTQLAYPVTSARMLGVPLPGFLRPRSSTRETVDAKGRPCFDVRIDLPIGGHIATYTGWLEPDD